MVHGIIISMAVKIRLRQVGKKRRRSYWIVAADSKTKRDGKILEQLGFYDPHFNPPTLKIDKKRYQHWVSVGAQPTERVRKLVGK